MGKNLYLEQARYKVAELLSCSGNEIVFTRNTTESINYVAKGLKLSKNDKVIVFTDSHHSNFLPWLEEADVQLFRTEESGSFDLNHYQELLAQQPKVVSISHCSNVTGVYCPLEEMIQAAKQVGAIVVVDAAQSVPHRKLNVKELKKIVCFFLANTELHGNNCTIVLDSGLGEKILKMPFHCNSQEKILVRLSGPDDNYVEARLPYGGRSDWIEIGSKELTRYLKDNEGKINTIEIFT